MLSSTATYALRAMIYLASCQEEGPVRVDDVAEALGVPRNYLSKVLHTLVKRGVLRSLRGPHGGFQLAVAASQLMLFDVVVPFDEIDGRRSCLLGRGECSDENPCAVHTRWSGVATEVAAFFRETALEDVVEDPERKEAILGQ